MLYGSVNRSSESSEVRPRTRTRSKPLCRSRISSLDDVHAMPMFATYCNKPPFDIRQSFFRGYLNREYINHEKNWI